MFKTQMSTIMLELVTSYKRVRWRIRLILGSTTISISRTRWIIVTTFSILSRKRTSKIVARAKVSLRNTRWPYLSSRVDHKVLKSGTVAKFKISMLKTLIPNLMKSRKKKFIRGPENGKICTKLFLDQESMGQRRDQRQTWKGSSLISRKAECKD